MKTFSITIPTRDRPALFREALDSVLAQSYDDYEIIVIDDGSNEQNRAELENMKAALGERVRWFHLIRRENGHGHPFARNMAATHSNSRYICTLDDDDTWIDIHYLSKLKYTIDSHGPRVDAVFSNQTAYQNDQLVAGPLWLDCLKQFLEASGRGCDRANAYSVTLKDILDSSCGFCHLNNLVLRKEFYEEIGGLDETLRYEPDRDVFLRVVDCARTMLYLPDYIARHNVPDKSKSDNVSTRVNSLQKLLIQLRILGKGTLFSSNEILRDDCATRSSYVLKSISEEMLLAGRRRDAFRFAVRAFGAKPGVRGGAYSLWLLLLSLFKADRKDIF